MSTKDSLISEVQEKPQGYVEWRNELEHAKDKNAFIEQSLRYNMFVDEDIRASAIYYLLIDPQEKQKDYVPDERYIRFRLGQVENGEYTKTGLLDDCPYENVRKVVLYDHTMLRRMQWQKQNAAEPHRVAAKPHHTEESGETHVWVLTDEEKETLTKYSPKAAFPAEKHLAFLIANNVIDANMGSTYLADVVQRAHFGKMYEWADRNSAKTKLRAYVHRIAQKYYSHSDYVTAAAQSMKIKKEALQKHECPKFDKELKKIL